LNETTQAPSGLQPASGSWPALHHLTSDAGPSATQRRIPAAVYLEQITKELWGLDTPAIGFNTQDENDDSDTEELDEADDSHREDGEMGAEDNGCWDEVTVAGTGISASDQLEEHFIHEAMSIGKDSFCNRVHVADVFDSESITIS
jgi:hypothetical protein